LNSDEGTLLIYFSLHLEVWGLIHLVYHINREASRFEQPRLEVSDVRLLGSVRHGKDERGPQVLLAVCQFFIAEESL
jgi:hypothetical protein